MACRTSSGFGSTSDVALISGGVMIQTASPPSARLGHFVRVQQVEAANGSDAGGKKCGAAGKTKCSGDEGTSVFSIPPSIPSVISAFIDRRRETKNFEIVRCTVESRYNVLPGGS